MRLLAISTSLLMFAAAASAQNGAIAGSVSDPFGGVRASAPVQAKNAATGTLYKASSAASGSYTLADLPAGTYDVSVTIGGLKGYEHKGVAVAAGKTAALNIKLEEGTQLSTLGEDPLAIAADLKSHNPPSGPTPRTVDGKPDLSGVWWSPRTVDPGKPQFLPKAIAVAKEIADNNRKDSPQAHCLPSAAIRLGPVYEMVQSPGITVVISDDDSPGFHQIYTDGRAHPKDPNPQWYGNSIGHWEGDTLIVDRVAFDPRAWLDQDAHPHSDKLHIVERYRRPDLGHLETEITVDDPGVLIEPWTMKRVSDLAPNQEIYEFICTENNKDLQHLVGK